LYLKRITSGFTFFTEKKKERGSMIQRGVATREFCKHLRPRWGKRTRGNVGGVGGDNGVAKLFKSGAGREKKSLREQSKE